MKEKSKENYMKDYDTWLKKKKSLNGRVLPEDFFFLEGEIWWLSIGVNIGKEIDGKHEYFERPVLIVKKFSHDTFLALPISTKEKDQVDFYTIIYKEERRTIYLQQVRFLSSNRLLQLITRIDLEELGVIKDKMLEVISRKEKTP